MKTLPKLFEAIIKDPEYQPILPELLERAKSNLMVNAVMREALLSDTEASPALIDSTDHTAAEKTKAVVLQCQVANDAVQGEQTDETLSFKYDEI